MPDDPASVMPHSNVIGVAPGGALVLEGAEEFTSSGTLGLKIYLIPTDILKTVPDKQCKELICKGGGSCLSEALYQTLPQQKLMMIPGAASADLFVIRGCVGNNGSTERCGADYTAGGNLRITASSPFLLSPDPIAEGSVHLTVAQLSESAQSLWTVEAGPGMLLTYGALGDPDAGVALLGTPEFGTVMPAQPVPVPTLGDADLPAFAQQGFTLSTTSGDGGFGPRQAFSLAQVQGISSPTELPPSFWNGSWHFLIALVGDATMSAAQVTLPDGGDNPTFDGYGLHVVAVPLQTRPPASEP
jgi:hypothetical protein